MTAEHYVFHVRPELAGGIAQQVQADGGGALLHPRGEGIETVRIPDVGKIRRSHRTAESPRSEARAAPVGTRDESLASRVSHPREKVAVARAAVSRDFRH